jgi:hypothetical protein
VGGGNKDSQGDSICVDLRTGGGTTTLAPLPVTKVPFLLFNVAPLIPALVASSERCATAEPVLSPHDAT